MTIAAAPSAIAPKFPCDTCSRYYWCGYACSNVERTDCNRLALYRRGRPAAPENPRAR